MDGETLDNTNNATDAAGTTENQGESQKYYTQEEFDKHMSGMRKALETKFEKKFSELGDIEELKQLKQTAEKQRHEEAMKKGEFEKVLQEMAQKKDAEIQKRDSVIKEYKVNTPLLEAAAKFKAVAPEQVKSLLQSNVRLGDGGEVEVVDSNGTTRYNDTGSPLSVNDLVQEFLTANPHFVSSGPSNSNTKSNDGTNVAKNGFDVSKLDFKNPNDRERYRKAKQDGLI